MTLHRAQEVVTVNIANGGVTSQAIASSGAAMYGLIFPAALTSTGMLFTVCDTAAGTFVALYDSLGIIVASIPVGTTRGLDLPTALAPWPFFKVVLGSAEAAARVLTLVTKG